MTSRAFCAREPCFGTEKHVLSNFAEPATREFSASFPRLLRPFSRFGMFKLDCLMHFFDVTIADHRNLPCSCPQTRNVLSFTVPKLGATLTSEAPENPYPTSVYTIGVHFRHCGILNSSMLRPIEGNMRVQMENSKLQSCLRFLELKSCLHVRNRYITAS